MTEERHKVRFGPFELDTQTGQLCKHDLPVKLHRQPAQILVMLVTRAGQVVTREQLRAHLWNDDTFVDFDHGLNNAINRLREVLADSATRPRYIETIPKTGYRFVAKTEETPSVPPLSTKAFPSAESVVQCGSPGSAAVIPQRNGKLAWWRSPAAVTLLALTLGMGGGITRSPQDPIRSLVVLPFENLSADPSQEYFSDGLTDALITELAGTSSLRVISRTSAMHYKRSRQTLPEIAHELNVDAAVEGTVLRADNRVRITAQLVRADGDRHLWSRRYDRDLSEILSLQQEVAQNIVQEVQAKVGSQMNPNAGATRTVVPAAYEAYLKGVYFSRQTFPGGEKAAEFFEEAVALDPKYGQAHAALAEIYTWNGGSLEKARHEAELAVALDENLSSAHAALAWVKNRADWDFEGAESEYRRALELSPGNVEARQAYGYFLACQGRIAEAFAQMEAARQLDPISPKMNMLYGLVLFDDHRYGEALGKFNRVLELDPESVNTFRHMMRTYEQMEDFTQAINLYRRAASWFGETESVAGEHAKDLQRAYEKGGARGYWERRLFIETHQDRDAFSEFRVAEIETHLGNRDHALDLLEHLCEERDSALVMWLKGPQFDPIRREKRYQSLLAKIGFPTS